MNMITTAEMKKLEDLSEKYGVSKLKLMENAGYGLYKEIKKYKNKKILIVCGSGNNGGDGLVLARYLYIAGFDVKVLMLGTKFKKESGFNFQLLKQINENIFTEDKNLIDSYDVIVDAMLGTGVKGEIKEPYSSVIDMINNSKKTIIAVDIPTGLHPDTGEADKIVKADIIFTFHDNKPGLEKFKDKVKIIDIGIPKKAIKKL